MRGQAILGPLTAPKTVDQALPMIGWGFIGEGLRLLLCEWNLLGLTCEERCFGQNLNVLRSTNMDMLWYVWFELHVFVWSYMHSICICLASIFFRLRETTGQPGKVVIL